MRHGWPQAAALRRWCPRRLCLHDACAGHGRLIDELLPRELILDLPEEQVPLALASALRAPQQLAQQLLPPLPHGLRYLL